MTSTKTRRKITGQALTSSAWDAALSTVLQRAETRGYILPQEIQQELRRLGLGTRLWRQFIERAGSFLTYQNGRYYYVPSLTGNRLHEEERQLHVRALLQALIDSCKRSQHHVERRSADRVEVYWPVTLTLEDGTAHRAVTRDISVSGIRFLGSRSLLGQRIVVRLTLNNGHEHVFSVRILWTCEVGDSLYENGGSVLQVLSPDTKSFPSGET
ncbi:hypothetical protein HRbin36_01038 [bacterium HR36]|nr:hypothetical protein HRbin36_01038 [bacterium HR36]